MTGGGGDPRRELLTARIAGDHGDNVDEPRGKRSEQASRTQ